MAPPGDPNVFLIDSGGKVVEQHAVGQRWIGEVVAMADGHGVAAICTSPTGAAEDDPALFRFSDGNLQGKTTNDFRPLLFQYGEHSNHLAPAIAAAGRQLALLRPDGVRWLGTGGIDEVERGSRYGHHDARVSSCAGTELAEGAAGSRLAVGWVVGEKDSAEEVLRNLAVFEAGKTSPVWVRAAQDCKDVEPAPTLAAGLYGPHTQLRDERVWAPLSIAVDPKGVRVAAADYQGYERFVLPRTPDESLRPPRRLGIRFTPSRPTIHVYDVGGGEVRRFDAAGFARPGWFDLAFNGTEEVLAYPHHWASRGLAGRPLLPADDDARTLYLLSLKTGDVLPVQFPDAISDVACAGATTAVGCWNGRVYLLGPDHRPIQPLPRGFDAGEPSLVRLSADGSRLLVANSAGVIYMLDGGGRELWRNDLARTATPGEKPWARGDHAGSKIGPGVWRNNTGRTPSDLGNQIAIEAPDGLLLVDPNAGFSLEQNWAMMKAEGLDPMRVKYILPTHEHGDHAPGSYLWRVITGAKVIASPEMTYTLQHDLPYTSGYGFHPPVPVDVHVDRDTDMDLCGLKVRVLRLPGHTYGSMGCMFDLGGRRYVCTGDLIMPDGPLGYSGSVNFWAPDVLESLKKLNTLKPDYVLCGHGNGTPDHFIDAGIRAGEATGWGKMAPPRPDPTFGLASNNYQVVGWLEDIYAAAFGDIDGDGLPDVAILTPGDKGLNLEIYLDKNGRFDAKPDKTVELRGMGPGMKVRIDHLTAGKVADILVSTESKAVLLLADRDGALAWHVTPVEGAVRAATFSADRTLTPPQCVIGERFVQGCRLCQLLPDGSLKTTEGPKFRRTAMELKLVDVNGDGRSDLVTAGGEIFLRDADGRLPDTASLTLDRPYGDWTYLAIGDFNGDGKPDIAQAGMQGLHLMTSVFYNTGDPRQPYHPKPDSEIDLGPELQPIRDGPTVADYNGDGIDDLILGHAQRQNIVIVPGSKSGLDRAHSLHQKVDYRLHYDTKIGVLDLYGKGTKSIADLGISTVGASGVYIRMPDAQP
jgi:glyoxylase-like metal-dependent hydrolase (beta-lactamase superfamily II)